MNTKAKRLLITVFVESKLPSVLILSPNTILMLKLLDLPILSCYSLPHETVPSPVPLERNITCVHRWTNGGRSCVGQSQNRAGAKSGSESWLGGPFPSPQPEAHCHLHTQLVVSSLEVGHNSNNIAEKAWFAFYRIMESQNVRGWQGPLWVT